MELGKLIQPGHDSGPLPASAGKATETPFNVILEARS
jgi:hypothetical protein